MSDSYITLFTSAARNLKLARASGDARWLYIQGLCYTQDAKTDGFIHDDAFPGLGLPVPRPEWATELEKQVLWHRVENGWEIHDYLKCNDSKEIREQKRAQNARRKRDYDARLRGLKVIDVTPPQRRLAEPDVPEPGRPEVPMDQGHTTPPRAPVPTPVPVVVERPRPLTDSPIRQAHVDARYGFIGPRFRVPAQFHQELVGRYGGDIADAEIALQKWYRSLEASLLQGESIPNIYEFINKHFAAWVASRAAKTPAAPVAKRGDDQRQGVTDDFREQLEAAQARKAAK